MPGPSGAFIGLPQSQLDEIRAAAIARMNGQTTSRSAEGMSRTIGYDLDPAQVLKEVRYAEQVASGQPRPQKIVQILHCEDDYYR